MPTFPTDVDTVALARRLNSSNDAERQQAQADLQALIAGDIKRLNRIRKLEMVFVTIYGLLYIPAVMFGTLPGHGFVRDYSIFFSCGFIGVLYLFSQWKSRVARNIAVLDIPQAIGPLIEVYATSQLLRNARFKGMLIQMLPRLQATDTILLTSQQRKCLYRCLSNDEYFPYYGRFWGADLKIAILKALEQIGDEKAVPHVEKLARTARNPQVRFAAQECLPYVQQRAEHARVEQTLLRAGTQPDALDTLLRPVVSSAPTEPQQLLRASNTGSETQNP